MSAEGARDTRAPGSLLIICHGAGVEFSKEGLPRRLVQEQGGAADVLDEQDALTVVTEVTVTVEGGGIVGHWDGDVGGGQLDEDVMVTGEQVEQDGVIVTVGHVVGVVTGGEVVETLDVGAVVVARQEQALESLEEDEEHGLAKAGIVGRTIGFVV